MCVYDYVADLDAPAAPMQRRVEYIWCSEVFGGHCGDHRDAHGSTDAADIFCANVVGESGLGVSESDSWCPVRRC